MSSTIQPLIDEAKLRQLNEKYIDAFMNSDVGWYESILADDFVCIGADGHTVDKKNFLLKAAQSPSVTEYRLVEVDVRIHSGVALVRATGEFTRKDGTTGMNRYTDVYVRSGFDWQVVMAQITPVSTR